LYPKLGDCQHSEEGFFHLSLERKIAAGTTHRAPVPAKSDKGHIVPDAALVNFFEQPAC
jgi:hypothetical protein